MNDELIYLPTSELVRGCCNGDIDVHHPLTLENRLGDKRVEMLFVDHLLNNSKKDKVPFIKMLSDLRSSIKDETGKLIEDNSFVKHLVDSSIKEWRRDVSPYEIFHSDIDDDEDIDQSELFDYSKLTNESNETTETKKKISELEELLKQKRENGVLEYSEDTDRDIRDLYHRSTKCKNRIEGHLEILNKIKKNIDPKHIHLLMDLGMKNKSEYMKFFKGSNESPITYYLNDRNSIGIPKNIQTVFTNYTLINNLIHKELDYIEHKMNELKKIADENNSVMKEFVTGLDTHDYIHDIYEPDNPVDSSEEEDEEETIKKYVIREDTEDKKEDESESLLSRLSSYFTDETNDKITDKDKEEIASLVQESNIDKEMNDKINNETVLFADAGDDDY